MKLEVITYTLADSKIAQAAGADRIEVITAPAEGGLTPSLGLVEEIREHSSIDMRVMVRPHSRHFHYDADDIHTILKDARTFRRKGIDGLVFGALTPDKKVDEDLLARFIDAADGLPVTFHRAIDEVRDQQEALRTLSKYPQVTHVLTSGGKPSALLAQDTLRELNQLAAELGTLTIIAGAGIGLEALPQFLQSTGLSEIHIGSGVRMDNQILSTLDSSLISQAKALIHSRVSW
ncbi:copper homeostasis protein CutC [Paenibacillus tuaregi]|uniref:copper homeostasis protein CutC n=1 Tax=Paenibacillus tuaregi TaxID=1816681 RepID=UPI0009ED7B94|nr:copper homeostasis protein CutC [Paenibacillus tuaregi]